MGLTHSPSIVTRNLICYADAANVKSYSGSGTSWNDLSGSSKHITLMNNPTYLTSNGGNFSLDGTDDYINVNHQLFPLNAVTFDLWLKPSNNDTLKIFWMGETQMFFNTVSKSIFRRWYNNNSTPIANTETFTQNYNSVWTNVCWTIGSRTDTVYINGLQVGSNRNSTITAPTITGLSGQTNYAVYIGRDEEAIYLPFSVASVKIYNIALSSSEVLQNFNAMRSRFGL